MTNSGEWRVNSENEEIIVRKLRKVKKNEEKHTFSIEKFVYMKEN